MPQIQEEFHRIQKLPPYVFAVINEMRAKARAAQIDVIDLGMGNPDGATPRVTYRKDGAYVTSRADYCLNCIPMHLLAGIEHNFPADYAAGFTAIPRGKLFKIGFQMNERFWEREGIYGGISWTLQDIQQIWYPAHGIHRKKGVVLGAYTFDPGAGEKFARLPPAERLELAIQQAAKIHPHYASHVESGVSIAWHQMNHMLGCAAQWDEALFKQWFARLQAPAGSHYLIGDQVSYHPGWQEGAIDSAHHAIADIDARSRMGASQVVHS